MTAESDAHRRRSVRLRGYDYSQPGMYFVTICAAGRESVFGKIVNAEMHSNQAGRVVEAAWRKLPGRYTGLGVDACIVMPNHMHGVIVLHGGISATPLVWARFPRPALSGESARAEEGAVTAPLQTDDFCSGGVTGSPATLGKIVAYFKYGSAKRINVLRGMPGAAVWKRGYYEHIIRGGESLDRIRRYIAENPGRWAFDGENPDAAGPEPEAAR